MEQKRFLSPLVVVLGLSGIFFLIFLVISGVFFFKKGSLDGGGDRSTSAFFSREAVGVIEVDGVIMDSKKTLAKLERFEEDDQIKAVVVRLNSPGGAVAPSQEIYQAVKNYKKPIVASMASVAASGAYYIACGAKKIFANPGTMTGSIGVIMEFANIGKLYDWAKIQRYSIKTGKYKDAGAEYRAMTEEEKRLFQTMVNDVLDQFKQAVAAGRKLTLNQVSAIADGRIFSGNQALAVHLVDELGTLRDAVQEAARMAKIKGKPAVVYINKPKRKLLDLLMDDTPEAENSSATMTGLTANLGQLFRLFQGIAEPASGTPSRVPGIYWIWGGGGGFR